MSNKTDSNAKQIHGMNPQFILETILRNKIYNTLYWKQHCFALTSETIIDKAVELKYIGGSYGPNKIPTEFICLILKMLQIQPSDEIIAEYLSDDCADYKYLRALAALYYRLTGKNTNVYIKLEPLLNDYRKLRVRNVDGSYSIIHMDEFIEDILTKESIFDIILPSLTKRSILEASGDINPRVSLLEADLDLDELDNTNIDNKVNNNDIDYLNDLNLDNYDQKVESDSDSSSGSEMKKVNKKRKIETNICTNDKDTIESIDDRLKKLDPNSAEYWLEMRKKIGLN